ncbi:hypothetical protein DAEQUDRAFT_172681 [Daedalea quercina L-15889]|uniref:Nephrocystin 3-like N-terminal domain-containing protein n=1 Tax=Daedalea quercina L-15889 TaxID=1314783 RepID=A0A165KJ39_9APHY|nr:hypothetical protein DAEQUDRAFT_172681 [Daedalea quercina L-15889]
MAEGHDRRKQKHLGLFEGLIPRRRPSPSAQASRSVSPTATLTPGAVTPPASLRHLHTVSGHPVTQASASAHDLSPDPSSSEDHARTGTVLDNEPTEAYSGPVSTGLAILKSALQLTEKVSDVCPHLKVAVGGLLGVVELIEQFRDVHEDFKDIAAKIDTMVKTLGKYQSWLSVNQIEVNEWVDTILHKIEQLKSVLEKKLKRNVVHRALLMPTDRREVVRCIRAVGDSVDIILMNMNIEELAKLDMLVQSDFNAKLSPVKSARYDAMDIPPCLEETRVQLLEDILAWAVPGEVANVPPVFFLSGVAGSGKSTVAKSVCARLQDMGILGASFFCSRRSTAEQRDVRSIFRTLAYLLSLHSLKFATEVREALKNDPDAAATVPKDQFRMLIDTPAKAAFTTEDTAPIIVIDAVDECDGADATYELLEIILRQAPRLHLKFLVTSRPEARIRDVFGKPGSTALRLQDIESDVVNADIDKYLTSTLSGIENNWPSPNDINTLVSRSRGLFIYAATACKYVTYHSGDRRERLQKLVSPHGRPLADMEEMYDLILDQAQLKLDDEEASAVRRCLTAIACARDSLSLYDFAHFLDLTPRKARVAFAALHSVVDVPKSDDGLLTTYHASFPEYLISGARSASKVADPKVIHREFFEKCLEIMKSGLFFNVSGCSTSYATNTKQSSHSELSPCLRYACRFFIDHLTMSSCSVNLAAEKVSTFLWDDFLYWVEALSASGHAGAASSLVMKLVVWFRAQASADMTESVAACLRLLLDANQFLVRFRTPILSSAPHIYLSALAFTPPDSEIARAWQDRLERRLVVHTKQQLEAIPLLRLHGHESWILRVAFSADGRQIVSASEDGIIRFWDSGTGDAIGQPVQGPIHRVRSVAFSPDRTHVVFAFSEDGNYSLLIWDAKTGHTVGHPLKGHTGYSGMRGPGWVTLPAGRR